MQDENVRNFNFYLAYL